MAQQTLARVTCPACQNPFQARVEQILDVSADQGAKMRVLNGIVNVAQCPHCGAQGALNLPFLYHDPEKELALVYMPMEAGRDNEERQRLIGRLTSMVIDSLPSERRKAYLLQPDVFLTLENLRKRILKADGVTDEMIEEQKAKAQLLQRMLDAASDGALEAMIEASDETIDATFFRLLDLNLEMARASGRDSEVQSLAALRDKLLELSSEGQAIAAGNELLEALREEPNRENLLDLLLQATDERTRELLVAFGRPLMDYPFFQNLTSKIEAASQEDERQRLTALRREILDIRDRIDERTEAMYQARAEFLRELLTSDDPEGLARRRFREIDAAFLNVLTANLEQAQKDGNEEAVKSLQEIWDLVVGIMEETVPPELGLIHQLMNVEDEAEIDSLLEQSRALITDGLVQALEDTESERREEGDTETADRLALVVEKMKGMVD